MKNITSRSCSRSSCISCNKKYMYVLVVYCIQKFFQLNPSRTRHSTDKKEHYYRTCNYKLFQCISLETLKIKVQCPSDKRDNPHLHVLAFPSSFITLSTSTLKLYTQHVLYIHKVWSYCTLSLVTPGILPVLCSV